MSECWDVQVFYDGDCPLCAREINLLRKLDRKDRILMTDIAASDFDAAACGVSQQALMGSIHARLPDGSWVEGVEVFRRLYGAVGLRWLVAPTRLPGISALLDWAYQRFAKNRLKWTGRCKDGVCELPVRAGTGLGS